MKRFPSVSITHGGSGHHTVRCLIWAFVVLLATTGAAAADQAAQREQFRLAWEAASKGDHDAFRKLGRGLEDYILYPYHRYEDYRVRRAQLAPDEMARFLDEHDGWAFAPGLKTSWLKSLGSRKRWQDLAKHAAGQRDTIVRCYLAQANIELGNETGLMQEVQSLWTVGHSQPDSCDPAFDWLLDKGGITPALAWERIRLAMQAGNWRFTRYLARFIPAPEQVWVRRWQDLNRSRYRNLAKARTWPDEAISRMIVSMSLQRFARQDADEAGRVFNRLDSHFGWDSVERGLILREIALQGAIALSDDAPAAMAAVPPGQRDEQLLEWWARLAMVRADWATVDRVIGLMPPQARTDGRWRYWRARARLELGETVRAREILESLSLEASYHGFLAADTLGLPYTICPLEPQVEPAAVEHLRSQPDFARALELRKAGIDNWAQSEWSQAARRLDVEGLRTAAALASQEEWHDRVIFALGDSGDRQFYDWRFPLPWEQPIEAEASRRQLDSAWVRGVIRSESAMSETARSSAGALGLMQVMPATARRLARKHRLKYTGSAQLKIAEQNIRFGTTFMRELMDRFQQNPVLVSSAYNAGPEAVDRWLGSRPAGDAAVWIESIPYFETRDYIPRVLAFTAIYDWRLNRPVRRVASRMPRLDSGKIGQAETTEVVCPASG